MIRRYFSAANTVDGFVNYFDDAADTDKANQIIYIKGGSGVGKSTFMKKISSKAVKLGYDVTHIHCSSDPSSLDGIIVDGKGIAVFDATAPHIQEPKYPMLNGRIINLADFLSHDVLAVNGKEIMNLVNEKKESYARLYALLSSVKGIDCAINKHIITDCRSLDRISDEIYAKLCRDGIKNRRGFLKAISENGITDLTSDILKERNVITLCTEYEIASQYVLTRTVKLLNFSKKGTEQYFSPFAPDSVEAFNTKHYAVISSKSESGDTVYDINSAVNIKNASAYNELSTIRQEILKQCSSEITRAKEYHKALEKYYIAAMDFDSSEKLQQDIIDYLFS